jgi:hypothetical protein
MPDIGQVDGDSLVPGHGDDGAWTMSLRIP